MTAQRPQGIAHSLGYGLGRVVAALFSGSNAWVRWLKRFALVVIAVAVIAQFGSWLAAAAMTVVSIALALWALSKVSLTGGGMAESDDASLFGKDVFGRKLNWLGELEVPDQNPGNENI
ncbi:hypothetical protein [Pseudomonas moorei]|uniref:hypothetical protein n=1 Tax=Pseudomonas moorei TaxID=395599 RepID=UPI00200BFB0D|nr:hypothetical protein [Pseudomonas moorei]